MRPREGMGHVQAILVPSDGSPPSLAALREASMLAEDLGARVDVLFVRGGAAESAELDEAFAAAQRRLGDRLRRRTEEGDPLRMILEAGRDYDLIVMGTHGRIGRLHALLGSVAEGVVRNAPCPVLTVRAPDGEESFAEHRHRIPSIAEQTRPPR